MGTRFHGVEKHAYVAGGGIGESIYGPTFEDENFRVKYNKSGIVTMENDGVVNTNRAGFIILTGVYGRASLYGSKNVAFGRVIKGLGLLQQIHELPKNEATNVPNDSIIIEDCGEIDDGFSNYFKDGDILPEWPQDLPTLSTQISWWTEAIDGLCTKGQDYIEGKEYKLAYRKYDKALRYLMQLWELTAEDNLWWGMDTRRTRISTKCAACKLELQDHKGAVYHADQALKYDYRNMEALILKALAETAQEKLIDASHTLDAAAFLNADDDRLKEARATWGKKVDEKYGREKYGRESYY